MKNYNKCRIHTSHRQIAQSKSKSKWTKKQKQWEEQCVNQLSQLVSQSIKAVKARQNLLTNNYIKAMNVHWHVQAPVCAEMEKAIKIAQIQKRPKSISTKKFATKHRKWPIKLWKICIIYADSTGADCSGADNTVSKALFTQSFPRLKISTDVSAASAAFSISECAYMH